MAGCPVRDQHTKSFIHGERFSPADRRDSFRDSKFAHENCFGDVGLFGLCDLSSGFRLAGFRSVSSRSFLSGRGVDGGQNRDQAEDIRFRLGHDSGRDGAGGFASVGFGMEATEAERASRVRGALAGYSR